VGSPPRPPRAPVGAFWPALNGRGCASLFPRVGLFIGGMLKSLTHYPNAIPNLSYPFLQTAAWREQRANGNSAAHPVTALNIEFVAKPEQAHRVEAAIPGAIAGALKDVAGFAGYLMMISDQEARLVTVITLWAGDDRAKYCSQNARWVHALLAPFLDRCLRVQTMVAHSPVLPLIPPQSDDADVCSMMQNLVSEDETTCAV
jgi:hypothetical protein